MNAIEFCQVDKTFNEAMFITKANNIFVKFLTNIMMDRLDEVKHFVSDDVYSYGLNILNNAKSNGNRQMYDELNVKSSTISSIEVKDDVYVIKVYLQSRYMNYIISLSNGSYVSGNNSSRIEVDYELTFKKKIDSKVQGIARKCPTCGAPMNVNNSGKCEYCGSIYNQEDYDWVLSELKVC